MAETGRGARRQNTSQRMIPNARREYALARAVEWADHAQAQYYGPYQGETNEEREASRQMCMAVAYNSKEMALMWARVAEVLPHEIPVSEDEPTPSGPSSMDIVP